MTMHCGYPFYLFLVLWVELAAGRALPTNTTDAIDNDMKSIIEDLQAVLKEYGSDLDATHLGHLPDLPCSETAAHLEQSSTVALRLSQYQSCAQKLQSFSPVTLCRAATLNKDLLLHLGSFEVSAGCPTSSSSPPSDFNSIRKSIQCVHCWSQQVAALHR